MTLPAGLLRAGVGAAEAGRVPDPAVRWAIRRLCRAMRDEGVDTDEMAERMRRGPIAPAPREANVQHYEVPPRFFELVLGPHRKYSSGYWAAPGTTLEESEAESLRQTAEHAGIADGQRVLELGCGWGSLTLWMAERFPGSRFTAVTNSTTQAPFIREVAERRGLVNVEVIRVNVEDFRPEGRYDRVVSVEMFEHLWNWEALLGRIAEGLAPDGRVLIHVFRHVARAHVYRTDGPDAWMGRYFFTGGIMPSRGLLNRFGRDFRVEEVWDWDGTHYARTSEAWLRNLDARKAEVMPVLRETYGDADALRWFHRWRIFFLACAEFFAYAGGGEWGVSHYRLARRDGA